jgi:Ca-activated chloride channel homolog
VAEQFDELDILRSTPVPAPAGRQAAIRAGLAEFDRNNSWRSQGRARRRRLIGQAISAWRGLMHRKLIAAPALAALVGLPLAGYIALDLSGRMQEREVALERPALAEPAAPAAEMAEMPSPAPPTESKKAAAPRRLSEVGAAGAIAPSPSPALTGMPVLDGVARPSLESRDRIQGFATNPIHATAEEPVSTFSLDVDTASYSFVRRALKEGALPPPDTVRVEELINYFPYDWPVPADRTEPFRTTVTVMPTPWNSGTKLLHVAVKGFELQAAARPRANLVFLIDVSGSMDEPDKLPLLRSAFRLLVNRLSPDDTVSIVTYAGDAGTVLEPTKASEREKILAAVDRLEPGGATAGAAGIEEAYRLARQSFVQGGVNRVLLATDGDFNVGQADDASLKRLIEEKRAGGIFLSVLGFGRGNLNDQMMQTLAQNGNGAAAYIDSLSEAQKVLVDEASSTLFPIAKDVKIQVEFNPEAVSEYRLIGYETRALAREDFNNDRVDAGDVGAGSSVTAIYEITPKGSPSETLDPLRYGTAAQTTAPAAGATAEYAYVKVRYKLPDQDVSKLITTPVAQAAALPAFGEAEADQRFSVAVAAFGQKLRDEDATARMSFDAIADIAAAARGSDPFGYRTEFLSLVRLASALEAGRRQQP